MTSLLFSTDQIVFELSFFSFVFVFVCLQWVGYISGILRPLRCRFYCEKTQVMQSFKCVIVWQLLGERPGQYLLGLACWAHRRVVVSMVLSLWEILLVQRFLNLVLMAVSLCNLQLSYRLHNYVLYESISLQRANYREAYILHRYEDRWIDTDRL